MSALVVFAHPLKESLGASLCADVVAALRARGTTVDICDLYAEGFAPALPAGERIGHYSTPAPEPDVVALQARLAAADTLVLVFPTWWFGLPAILKGWIDRVWAPGFAYELATPLKPLLGTLRACLVVTTLGSPWWVDRAVMGRPVRRILRIGVIGSCAPQAKFEMLSLHSAEEVSPERVARFRRRIASAVGRLP